VNAVRRQPEKVCYVVLDSAVLKMINSEGREPMEQMGLPPGVEERFEKDYKKCIDEGYALIADTVGRSPGLWGSRQRRYRRLLRNTTASAPAAVMHCSARTRAS